MTTIRALLDEYTRMARDTREKGLLLERLARAYFTTDPTWTARFEEVWLWQDWPGRDGKVDTGIDLVAREYYGGGYCAIQCKFFDPSHAIQKADIDSFFTASGKRPFTSRLVVSTTTKWSKHAEDALVGQQITTAKIGIDEFAASGIDWGHYSLKSPDDLSRTAPKTLRPHQVEALEAVQRGFADADRGKLIMACGTGKTFTSLRIAEAIAGGGGSVLFLVPSIALLSQTLKEWSAERRMPLRAFAICSDSKVGKYTEDYSVSDLSYPATTSTEQLLFEVAKSDADDGLTVYFSTYQSIDVVARAQAAGLAEFDLVVCDEAHRTAGFTLENDSESSFLRIHDETAIRAKKRLYMTATPKIYAEAVRTKASDKNAVLVSMDDEHTFGPVFHRLGFGAAVEANLLTDYRVLVLAVNEESISSSFQEQWAVDGELNIPDAARIMGIYNGLAKRGVAGLDSTAERKPLRRAVAFSRSIKDSQKVQSMVHGYDGQLSRPAGVSFVDLAEAELTDEIESRFRLEARHVDGTMNVLLRNQHLDWLKEEVDEADDVCRILTNARCLSEGVDVPALDAVIFLNSRDSQVDVVQSVGRVMRKVDGKDYGYIILPIAVEAGKSPEQALNDNTKYKVVWDVLRALRAHDERFEAKIEQIDLNRRDPQLQAIAVPGPYNPEQSLSDGDAASTSVPLDWSLIGADWREAIYAKMVEKVGERDYWENWARDVAAIATRHQARIETLVNGSDARIRAEFAAFGEGLRNNLNPSISEADAIEMISQHLITKPVFDALFEGYEFSEHNPVSVVMQRMVDALEGSRLDTETEQLEGFYANVRRSVAGITDAAGKQTTIKRLYEKFFAGAFRGTSERLGIVYTPNEIVDFILTSADQVLRSEFGATLSDEGVHVLDPFTGTGTFIVRLLQSGLIRPEDLQRKYLHELHANELVLLAYYVAAVNIEATYRDLAASVPEPVEGPASTVPELVEGPAYLPFPGIVLTDTFQSSESDDRYDDQGIFGDNNERVKAQNALPITVIVGNPPYSSGQDSANDNNQNLKYPFLDARIAATYAAGSTAQNKNSLYDSYIRAIRWASDRIKDRGVVGFVSNGGFLDGNTADGLRKSLAAEFSSLYVFNLRGNARTSGEQRRKEKDGVFGAGSRATVAISILVKNPDAGEHGRVQYRDIGDYLSREQKLALVTEYGGIEGVPWEHLEPNDAGDWLNQRDDVFGGFTPMGDKDVPGRAVFRSYSRGLESARDAWVYNSSSDHLSTNVENMVSNYNDEVDRWNSSDRSSAVESFIDTDPKRISWARSLRGALAKGTKLYFNSELITTSMYRPFNKQHVYFARLLNHERSQIPKMFPTAAQENFGFYYVGMGSAVPFSILALDSIPDLHVTGAGSGGQFFPRYTYEPCAEHPSLFDDGDDFTRVDNITDEIHGEYQKLYGDPMGLEVEKDDIFHFVYGLLHSPDYLTAYASDLKKMLPRIPLLAEASDFWDFVQAGQDLSDLHLDYEEIDPYPLEVLRPPGASLRVTKMRFGGKAGAWDKSTIRYNDEITLTGIPDEAHEYLLGSRTAIEWILERYQVKTDKASGIRNDPNDWGDEHDDPEYILNLLLRIVTVSVETVAIVAGLPPLRIKERAI